MRDAKDKDARTASTPSKKGCWNSFSRCIKNFFRAIGVFFRKLCASQENKALLKEFQAFKSRFDGVLASSENAKRTAAARNFLERFSTVLTKESLSQEQREEVRQHLYAQLTFTTETDFHGYLAGLLWHAGEDAMADDYPWLGSLMAFLFDDPYTKKPRESSAAQRKFLIDTVLPAGELDYAETLFAKYCKELDREKQGFRKFISTANEANYKQLKDCLKPFLRTYPKMIEG